MSYQSKHTGTAIDTSVNTTQQILNMIYPVGSVYISVNNVSPSSFIGGTWERIQDKFLLAAGSSYSAGTSGGSVNHTHTTGDSALTINQIPAHTHTRGTMEITGEVAHLGHTPGITYGFTTDGTSFTGAFQNGSSAAPWYTEALTNNQRTTRTDSFNFAASRSWTGETSSVGSGATHNHGNTGSTSNLPPYLSVYMWQRTA